MGRGTEEWEGEKGAEEKEKERKGEEGLDLDLYQSPPSS